MTVNNSWASGDVKFITAQNMLIRAVGGLTEMENEKKNENNYSSNTH